MKYARVSQCIATELVDGIQWVDHVSLGLAHLLAITITHQPVHVDGLKWGFSSQLEAHHDHASNPKEKNVVARRSSWQWIDIGVGINRGQDESATSGPGVRVRVRVNERKAKLYGL
jgi:hypothetical protein